MRVVFLDAWFTDYIYRRVGRHRQWFGVDKNPGAYELRIGPFLVFVDRRGSA